MSARPFERLAELVVRFGANVQPGQVVSVASDLGKEELTRAVAAAAYRAGARFVDVTYFDPYVKRARLEHAPDETLDYVPPWYGARLLELGRLHAARISLAGPPAIGALDGLDPVRAGRDRLPWLDEIMRVIDDRTTNWSAVPCPTQDWAELVHPELASAEALDLLWDEIVHVCRLDEPDPPAAWRERLDALAAAAARLADRRFDALHLAGPGTDLTVGLLPSSRWGTARETTLDGVEHMVNLPSEEVFTTPDPLRVDGVVRSTRPLVLGDGTIVRGLVVGFEDGRAVSVDADAGADVMRARVAADDGASRLGEIALVDAAGRIGPLGTVFYETLLDENATSHIALGGAFEELLDEDERPRANHSKIHVDFMVGGDDVEVTGLTASGERVPVLRGGSWQI